MLWIAPLAFLGLFYFYPLASILITSFEASSIGGRPIFLEVITSAVTADILWFTIWQALLSTGLTLLVGLPGAYLLARYRFRGKTLLRALTGIPFVLPTIVVAAAFNALLGPKGWVNLGLQSLLSLDSPPIQFNHTIGAILLAHVFYNTTIVLRLVGDYWGRLSPRLSLAANILGANRWGTLRHVTIPMLMPAILAAALLTFIFDFTSFGVILILGGPRFATLEVEIYQQVIGRLNLAQAASLSILQLVCTLGLMIAYTWLSNRLTRPMDIQSEEVTQSRLITTGQKILAGSVIAFLLLLLTSPLVALATRAFTSFSSQGQLQGFTTTYFSALNQNPQNSIFFVPPWIAVRNSLLYAGATVIVAVAMGLPAAWALARQQFSRLNRLLDPLLMLPLGTSAVTLGLGFIVALNQPPLNLRASPLLLPIAHSLVAFPFVVRSLTPALRSVQPQLRRAAAVMGANRWQVIRQIDLPLAGKAIFAAGIFAFTISMGEFGASVMIVRPEFPTVPVMIFRYLSRPGSLNFGQALALSTILMAVTGAGMILIERLRVADVGEF
jgi:thiamine transport system permease protein